MAPKTWPNAVMLSSATLQPTLRDSAGQIERCGWKSMDCEEFADAFLQLLKGLASIQ